MKKYIPSIAPGRVAPLMRRMNNTKYGKRAVKYATFPDPWTPLTRTKNSTSQEKRRHNDKCQIGASIPSSKPFGSLFNTTFLENKNTP